MTKVIIRNTPFTKNNWLVPGPVSCENIYWNMDKYADTKLYKKYSSTHDHPYYFNISKPYASSNKPFIPLKL